MNINTPESDKKLMAAFAAEKYSIDDMKRALEKLDGKVPAPEPEPRGPNRQQRRAAKKKIRY